MHDRNRWRFIPPRRARYRKPARYDVTLWLAVATLIAILGAGGALVAMHAFNLTLGAQ
jgi:hypothetical protein